MPSRMRSMPWFVISDSAVFPSMAWDFRSTSRTCKPTSYPFLPISNASLNLACRSISPSMDVALPVDANGNPSPQDLQRQADLYHEIATACLSHPGCTAIQTWGFTDKYSWIGSHSRQTQGAALPFDREYRVKPAYEALRNALKSARH